MKVIKIIFFSLLALSLIACTCLFIFFEIFDTDQYLPKLTQKASLVLGRPVFIGHVGLGFSLRGMTLDAGPVTVADDPAFTAQPFIKVDNVRISLDLRSLVFRHQIHITDILLQSPQIHFIRSQEGKMNAVSILHVVPYRPENIYPGDIHPEAQTVNHHSQQREEFHSSIDFIKSIRIQDADISFIDQNQTMPLDIWLMNINAGLNDFSLSKPFQLSFNASALLLKGISSGAPDSPVFKNIAGAVQLNVAGFTASGSINTTGGVIKNFNIIKAGFFHASGIFENIGGNIDNLLDGQLKDKLGMDDTIIDKMQLRFSVHDKTFSIDDFLIKTNIFELTAKGPVDQGLNLDLQTMLHLNEDISATLVNELDGLKYFMDDSQRIAIGASLKGVVPHLKYKPNKDFRKKSKKALMKEGGNLLGVLLGGGLK